MSSVPSGRANNEAPVDNLDAQLYHVVMDVKSVEQPYGIRPGWNLELHPDVHAKVNQAFTPGQIKLSSFPDLSEILQFEEKVAVAVVGLFNRGKTFLLNRLAGVRFRAGKTETTRGISFAVPSGYAKNLLLLDTEGRDSPLDREGIDRIIEHSQPFKPTVNPDNASDVNERQKLLQALDTEYEVWFGGIRKNAIVQKSATQAFLQDLIFRLANVIIVVVNEMTWQDQNYIDALTIAMEKHQEKELIIVHNFRETETKSEFQTLRQRYVIDVYPGKIERRPVLRHNDEIELFFSKTSNVRHVFLCKEGSDIGKEINLLTYEWLLNVCIHKNEKAAKPSKQQSFPQKLLLESQFVLCKLFKEPGSLSYNLTPDGNLIIRSNLEHDPQYIRNVVDVDMGNIVFRSRDFTPNVDQISLENKFLLLIDLPGFPEEKEQRTTLDTDFGMQAVRRAKQFELRGKRKLIYKDPSNSTAPYSPYDDIPKIHANLSHGEVAINQNRTDGEFHLKVRLPDTVDPSIVSRSFKNGQLQVEFNYYPMEEDEGFN